MKCLDCNTRDRFTELDEYEIVCEKCGSAFALEYLGYYREDNGERIDEPNPNKSR